MASRSLWSLLFVILVLFASEEMMVQVTGKKDCGATSKLFKGMCFSNENCANVCRTEDFTGGHCTKILRHCYCEAPCNPPPAPMTPTPPTPF